MSRRRVSTAAATAALLLLAGACSAASEDGPEEEAEAFAAALSKGDLTRVAFTAQTARQAQRWWAETSEGMRDSTHEVEVTKVEEGEDDQARATLRHTWDLTGRSRTWTYETTVQLVRGDDAWAVALRPASLAPRLTADERLDLTTETAERGDILGAGGQPLVTERPVIRFGIDKTQVKPARETSSARALAGLLGVDAEEFTTRVKAAGDAAFVEALVMREEDVTEAISGEYESIPGARALGADLPLAPTREFARAILGTVGPVTAEMIEKSEGEYAAGDVAGLSGLEQRYDERLRGRPGLVVEAVDEAKGDKRRLFEAEAEPGRPLRTTMDLTMQLQAERALADVEPASALVAIRPSTGELLAAASGPGSAGYSTATVGQYAPGSTFKVVSSLALLRAGLSMTSTVPCTPTIVVDGKQFKNYSDYPAGELGKISLRDAVAHSCNTAFISQHERVEPDEVVGAAAALGLGEDHDVGFPAYFGSVPEGASATGHAADLIGQGRVLASPMALAAVAGSVSAGRTVVPHLIEGKEAEAAPKAPLTPQEASKLRRMMAAVVAEGSGSFLGDLPGNRVIAKTGTAEFGQESPPETHAWMIAARGDLAVAVFVEVGDSGSSTAGPILEEFLRAAG